jgi:hypothetical protein
VGVGGGSTVVDVEFARPHDTANLFDLPVFCQYGIGGPSFNAWRELAANRIVTDAVLAGETAAFPLLHHWRVLPGRAPVAAEHADVDVTVARMGDSPAVRTRLEALAAATRSLVLFCEHVPHPVDGWLAEDPAAKADAVERQLAEVVAFLRDRELLHMDGHLGNLRTDGERLYLTDFGLVTSPRFDLSAAGYAAVRMNAFTGGCSAATSTPGTPTSGESR